MMEQTRVWAETEAQGPQCDVAAPTSLIGQDGQGPLLGSIFEGFEVLASKKYPKGA